MNIPEGWPTEEMMYAAQGVKLTTEHPNIVYLREVIRAALAAAPTPPVCQTCNGNGEIGGFVNAHSGYESEPCTDCVTPSAQTINLNDVAMERIHQAAATGRCKDFPSEYSGDDLISDICRWLIQPPAQEYSCPCGLGDKPCPDPATGKPLCDDTPAQEDEPVAMVYHHKSGAGIGGTRWKHLPHGTNLYTRPDDKLRKAAEEFAHVASMTKVKFDNDEHKAVFAEAYENLRAALE